MWHMMHSQQRVKYVCPFCVLLTSKNTNEERMKDFYQLLWKKGYRFAGTFGNGGYGHTSEAPITQRKIHSSKK